MNTATREIIFTVDEIREHSTLEGDPPKIRFIKKNEKIPGKSAYYVLLTRKISESITSHPRISIIETLKTFAKKTLAYPRCEHGINHSASFVNDEFQDGSELKWKVVIKCDSCLGILPDVSATSTTPLIHTTGTSQIPIVYVSEIQSVEPASSSLTDSGNAQLLSFNSSNATTKIFQKATKRISAALAKSSAICNASDDPLITFQENKIRFGKMILNAWSNDEDDQKKVDVERELAEKKKFEEEEKQKKEEEKSKKEEEEKSKKEEEEKKKKKEEEEEKKKKKIPPKRSVIDALTEGQKNFTRGAKLKEKQKENLAKRARKEE